MLFFINMGKEEGEVAARHCASWSFISMVVYFSLSICLFIFFFFSIYGHHINTNGISYYITCLFVFAFVCSAYIYFCTIISVNAEREILKAIAVGHSVSYDSKQLQCHSETVSSMIVQRKLRKKVKGN